MRIDAIPRGKEAFETHGPRIRLDFTDDNAGRKAADAIRNALEHGREVGGKEGVQITPEIPPRFKDVGR